MVIASRLGHGKADGSNPATLMEPLDENEEFFYGYRVPIRKREGCRFESCHPDGTT